MPWVKTAWWPIGRLPARRPFAGVTIEWCCIQSQPGDDGEGVAFPGIDRYPFAGTALAVAAKLG